MKRCGVCENCKRVAEVQRSATKAIVSADIQRVTRGRHVSVGEDVRLIWNRTLEENPCTRKYAVNWDNGAHACGTFPNRFDTAEEAQAFADNWVAEMDATDGREQEDSGDDGYSAEVIEVYNEEENHAGTTEETKA